jgi:phosphoserine aminotransferase
VLFTWNGTTSGVRVPNGDWIAADREGLTFCDATSAVFAYDMPWDKLDVVTFSWQKVLGGEGGHGVLILGPRAVERLESYTPAWPLPKVFRLFQGQARRGRVQGRDDQHAVDAGVEDVIFALEWAKSVGGLKGPQARSNANARGAGKIVEERAGSPPRQPIRRSAPTPPSASRSSRRRAADASLHQGDGLALEKEGAAYDIAGYRDAPPGLRIWCGATVETADIEALGAVARLGLRDRPRRSGA